MSDIYGAGYGHKHNWKRGFQPYGQKGTPYKCETCGVEFTHWYDQTPSIFTAIKEDGIPEFCLKQPSLYETALSAISDASNEMWDEHKTAIQESLPLMRAAPELLEALELITAYVGILSAHDSAIAIPYQKAKNAINKAKGN